MPEDPSTYYYQPSPIKNTPIRIPPPFPYGYDDSNYLNNTRTRTRQNILNLINAHEEENTHDCFRTPAQPPPPPRIPQPPLFHEVDAVTLTRHQASVDLLEHRFNSLSRSSARVSSDNGSSLPRSLVSSCHDEASTSSNNNFGLPIASEGEREQFRSENGRHDNIPHLLPGSSPIEINRRHEAGDGGTASSSDSNNLTIDTTIGDTPDNDNYITSTVSRNWEYVNVSLTRVPGYGFGIAVSGGCDNPHFANGDPAIAISDVLKGGPAQGKLQINDRIVSANGISLDNVDYSTAVQILRDSGPSVNLRVKRRVNPQSYKVSVPLNTKRLKKLSFESLGFTVSVTIQIKTVDSPSLGLREGDIIDKIQGLRVNELFNEKVVCKELRRVLEDQANGNSTNLNLTVKRTGPNNRPVGGVTTQQQQQQQQQLLANLTQPSHSVGNLYVQPPTRANNKSFDSTNTPLPPPPPMVINSQQPPPPPPPRPPLPSEFESNAATSQLRSINFIKQNQLGIRLSGGNKTGIIVSAVQKNSQADLQGLTTHDKIIRVNEHDFASNPPTREQAIEILSSIPNDTLVNLTVERVAGSVAITTNQDEFYIRTNVNTDEFKMHEVLVVTDTLVNGLVGQWEAYRMDAQGNRTDKLIIPNMKNGRELVKKTWKRTTSFRNREFEEFLQCIPATEPYDIVDKLNSEVHTRPVLLYTCMNDRVIESLMRLKQASRLFKVVKADELEWNDGRVRVVQEMLSVRGVQELYEKHVFPYIIFANFRSKEALKDACKDAGKYSKSKKLFTVMSKLREKLGSYVDNQFDMVDCESGAERIYNLIIQHGSSNRGVFYAAQRAQVQQSSATTPKRSQSTPRQSSGNNESATLHHRPSTSTSTHHHSQQQHHHSRHKSTDNLVTTPPQQQQSNYQRTPTSPSPASMNSIKFPNFNIPPPCSIIENNVIEPVAQREYEKRVNLHRSATSVGGGGGGGAGNLNTRGVAEDNARSSNTLHQVTNNFAHSPVLERKEFPAGDAFRRAQSNPPPGGSRSNGGMEPRGGMGGMGGNAPLIDRTKKPGSNANVFYPIGTSPSSKITMTPNSKPLPPPKPKFHAGSGVPMSSKPDVNRSLFRPVSNTSTNDSNNGDDDTGQTYLNIPMNSKAALQQRELREREFLQQQQQQQQLQTPPHHQQQQPQQQNITAGVFDWRGGRLVQKGTFGGQVPIEVFIPERAIPHGDTVNVWFQIINYNVREDVTPHAQSKKMLSPLVKFGPENYRFQIPVEIRIPQYSANGLNGNDNNMLAKVLMNNQSDYWTKIDIQNGNFQTDFNNPDVKIVSLTVQQF